MITLMSVEPKEKAKVYKCTDCGGDATVAYTPTTVKSSKNKGKQKPSWGGLVLAGERVCILCGRKRGIKFF
jgi:hypothetical protein